MEKFDLVNKDDKVIGTTDKTLAHANRQLHRVVAVYVFNENGDLFVQVHKASNGRYDHSVGGHVYKGEDYAQAASREADEELGIKQPLTYLSTFYSEAGTYLHMFGLFECIANKGWKFVPCEEVEEIIPMSLENIRKMMAETPEKFTSGFINTMKEYCRIKGV